MYKHLNSAANSLRLCVVTVLLAMLGFAFAAQFGDDSGYSDDTVRVRVAELAEHAGDSETPLQLLLPPLAIFASYFLAMVVIIVLCSTPSRQAFIVFQVIDNAPPRAPPFLTV